jgi:hypothetical protein
MARHWRMGAQSSDLIRQRLIQRGLTFEEALRIIQRLDEEEDQSSGFLAGRSLRGRLWVPIGGGARYMGFAPGTRTPQARSWLIGYTGFMAIGLLSFLINRLLLMPMLQCELIGYAFTGMGIIGLLMYVLNMLLWRFL